MTPAPAAALSETPAAAPEATPPPGTPGPQVTPPAENAPPPPTATPTLAPPRRETRALWVSRWDFKEHPDVQAIVDRAAYANLNVIFFQVRGQADAMYPSSLEPWSAMITGTLGQDPGWDPLAEMVERAHGKGIEVHAWLNVYPVWLGADPPPATVTPTPMYHEFNARYGDEWLLWQGQQPPQLAEGDYLWANPAHPAVVAHVVDVCKDLLARYPLDGLHLDFVRYPGPEFSEDPMSNRAYAQAAAARPGLTREDWQRDQVTTLVDRVRQEALPVRPGARLTTAAWPVYQDHWGWYQGKDGHGTYYQDSRRWSHDGLVSAILPMLYGPTIHDYLDRYEALARDHVEGARPGGVILGVEGAYDSFAPIAERIDVARQLGARGQALFAYRAFEEHGYWQALRDGPYREPALSNWP